MRAVAKLGLFLTIVLMLGGDFVWADGQPEAPLITFEEGLPRIQWFGASSDTFYSIKSTRDLSSANWETEVRGLLGLEQHHEWVDASHDESANSRFYTLLPWSDYSGITSESGVFTFRLGESEKTIFVSDSDARPLGNVSVHVRIVSDMFLVQAGDTNDLYYSTIRLVKAEQSRIDVSLRERVLYSDQEASGLLTSGKIPRITSGGDDYGFIPPYAHVEVIEGDEALRLLDELSALSEPEWKIVAFAGLSFVSAVSDSYHILKFIVVGTPIGAKVFLISYASSKILKETLLKTELDKWFARINEKERIIILMNDGTITTHGNIAGQVTDDRGNRLSDFDVILEGSPSIPLRADGAYIVSQVPAVPGGTTYAVTITPRSDLSIVSFDFRSRRVLEGTTINVTAWISDLLPTTIDVMVEPGLTANGSAVLKGTQRIDLHPVIKYRPLGSSESWTITPMAFGGTMNTWYYSGTIPGSALVAPGIEAFIEVVDGDSIARTPVAQIVPAASFVAIDSNPPGALIHADGIPIGHTFLSMPIEFGQTVLLTAHMPGSSAPTQELTVTAFEPEDRWIFFDFESDRSISITAPAATILQGGSTATVTWNTSGDIPFVDVLYRPNESGAWQLVADSLPNSGTHEWLVPNLDAPKVQLKVRDSSDHRIRGVSLNLNIVWAEPAPAGMVLIPAGNFQMGDTFNEGNSDERPVHTVYVSAFYMDRYEVTKALWDEVYIWATHPDRGANVYSFDNVGSGKVANHPVHTINWYDMVKWCNARSEMEGRTPAYYTSSSRTSANIYRKGRVNVQNDWARWDAGYRLPTEAEWEKAARGGQSGRRFPWGDTINHNHANYQANGSFYSYDTSPDTTWTFHPTYNDGVFPYTSPVGSFGANGYGLYDMAGNVQEWIWDWYGSSYYGSSPGSDPRGPTTISARVVRGGSWSDGAYGCRVAERYNIWPFSASTGLGFRVALPPSQ
jgi:formylglycine-generating enzyme required for sulfatase activity